MELSELRSFLVLADALHFGRAAKRLHITQPALTKQIQRLEQKLGGALFIRGYDRVVLTPAGEVLKGTAPTILGNTTHAEQVTRLAFEGKAGLLRIGFGIATLAAGLAPLLRKYRQLYPNVLVQLEDMSTPAQLSALEENQIDVGFVRLPVANESLETAPALEERLVVAVPPGMKVNAKRGLAAFAEAPFVGLSSSTSASYSSHVARTCSAAGFSPRIVQEAKEMVTILHCVGAGMGAALVPRSVKEVRVPQVRFVETGVDEARWQIGLAWRKRDKEKPLIGNFIRLVRR